MKKKDFYRALHFLEHSNILTMMDPKGGGLLFYHALKYVMPGWVWLVNNVLPCVHAATIIILDGHRSNQKIEKDLQPLDTGQCPALSSVYCICALACSPKVWPLCPLLAACSACPLPDALFSLNPFVRSSLQARHCPKSADWSCHEPGCWTMLTQPEYEPIVFMLNFGVVHHECSPLAVSRLWFVYMSTLHFCLMLMLMLHPIVFHISPADYHPILINLHTSVSS